MFWFHRKLGDSESLTFNTSCKFRTGSCSTFASVPRLLPGLGRIDINTFPVDGVCCSSLWLRSLPSPSTVSVASTKAHSSFPTISPVSSTLGNTTNTWNGRRTKIQCCPSIIWTRYVITATQIALVLTQASLGPRRLKPRVEEAPARIEYRLTAGMVSPARRSRTLVFLLLPKTCFQNEPPRKPKVSPRGTLPQRCSNVRAQPPGRIYTLLALSWQRCVSDTWCSVHWFTPVLRRCRSSPAWVWGSRI